MDYVVAILLGSIAVLLIAMLFELRKIRSSLAQLPTRSTRPSSETTEGRQTVTVNVGAIGGSESPKVTVNEAAETPAEESAKDSPPEEPLPVEVPEVKPQVRVASFFSRPASRGLGAVKCPHCGAENTSFRTECFQCSKPL